MESNRLQQEDASQCPKRRRGKELGSRRSCRRRGCTMPDGEGVDHGEGKRGLAEIEEHGLSQPFFTERREDNRISEVDRIDAAGGEQESTSGLPGQLQRPTDLP